jgi:hypothetical protein
VGIDAVGLGVDDGLGAVVEPGEALAMGLCEQAPAVITRPALPARLSSWRRLTTRGLSSDWSAERASTEVTISMLLAVTERLAHSCIWYATTECDASTLRVTLTGNEPHDRHQRGSDVALWVFSIGMGLAFAVSGAVKLVIPKNRLALRGASWVDDFSSGTVIFVGLTEIVGGLAIVLPAVLGIPPRLAVTAGVAGLIVVMLGAAVVHARRREAGMIVLNLALLALTAVALCDRPSHWY